MGSGASFYPRFGSGHFSVGIDSGSGQYRPGSETWPEMDPDSLIDAASCFPRVRKTSNKTYLAAILPFRLHNN